MHPIICLLIFMLFGGNVGEKLIKILSYNLFIDFKAIK